MKRPLAVIGTPSDLRLGRETVAHMLASGDARVLMVDRSGEPVLSLSYKASLFVVERSTRFLKEANYRVRRH